MTNFEQHALDTKSLQSEVRNFYLQGKKFRIYHGTTNSTRFIKFKKGEYIDISKFNRVVSLNEKELYILVEPNVPMDKLIEETLRYGLVPPVVPEFPGITIGGAVQGGAEESSSFKYGMVHDCCLEYEIVLGSGEVVTASREKNPDLFWGIAASYGSLGITTLIKLKLIPAKDFVHLTYHPVTSFKGAIELIKNQSQTGADFIDAIMFSKDRGVVMTGTLADKSPLPTSTFHRAQDDWFYLHADKVLTLNENYEEQIPIRDYLFRYDRGAFWMGQYDFKVLRIPFVWFTRYIFNIFFNTRTLFRIIHETGFSQRYFIQDFNLPSDTTEEFLNIADQKLGIYPLWICPLLPGKDDLLSANHINTDLVFNLGIWGEADVDYHRFVELNKFFEQLSNDLGGRKMLYAHQYYSEDEFWGVYDRTWYNNLREKWAANKTFPTIYEKTFVSEKYKPSILLGIINFLKSPFRARTFK